MGAKQMRGLARFGLVRQTRQRSWRKISINWKRYAEVYRQATGECNLGAKELLDQMTSIFWEYTFLSSRGGYAVGLRDTGEMVNLFPEVGMRGRFIQEGDANALVQAIGDSYQVLKF